MIIAASAVLPCFLSVQVGVLLAPRRAIRDTLIEAPSTALSNNIFTVEPAAAGASLVNVHLKCAGRRQRCGVG